MMNDQAIFKKNANFVSRVIDKETILMPIYKASHEINAIYALNSAAAMAWDMFDGKKTVAQVRLQVLRDFDTTPSEAEKHLGRLLKDLTQINALVKK